jgi:copper homeostasis protein
VAHPRRILLEVCIASADDAVSAADGGADRLELNSALALGGLTPTIGVLREVKETVPLPVVAMVRPRPGGFAYGSSDFRVLLRDAELLLAHGAGGLAVGVLQADGRVDDPRCREIRRQTGSAVLVFHRAFDVTPDPFESLEHLIDLGFQRVLTSGQQESAYNGTPLIAHLIQRAAGRIEILPAGGINRFTLTDVLARTGCDQVHASLQHNVSDTSTSARPRVSFSNRPSISEEWFSATNRVAVQELVQLLTQNGHS